MYLINPSNPFTTVFFFNDTATTEIYTLSLHDALPVSSVTFNQAGTYFWQAVYTGDFNNQGSSSLCTSETVAVGQVPTTLATTLSSSSILVGASVHDSA